MRVMRAEPGRFADLTTRSVGRVGRAYDLQLTTYVALLGAIGVGLVVGKPLGFLVFPALAVWLRMAIKPAGYSWRQLLGAGALPKRPLGLRGRGRVRARNPARCDGRGCGLPGRATRR